MTKEQISTIDELTEGEIVSKEYKGRKVGLCLKDGDVFGFYNVCPHQGGPIVEGHERDGWVFCPWHGREFSLKTGKGPTGNGQLPLVETTVEDGIVYIVE